MSYDEADAAYDDFIDRLYREHKVQAITEFSGERLQSYFLANTCAAKPSYEAYHEALRLHEAQFAPASFMFAHICTESTVRSLVLRPIVVGLVNDASTAELISDLLLAQTGLDRFKGLLSSALERVAGISLNTFSVSGSTTLLWDELRELQRIRNRLAHGAQFPSATESSRALEVAGTMIHVVFPALVQGIGLHLHDGWRVCADSLCDLEKSIGPEAVDRLRRARDSMSARSAAGGKE